MPITTIAFTNGKNDTILSRSATTPMTEIAKHVQALEQLKEEHIYAIRSVEDKYGEELSFEIITPAALAAPAGAQMARVEYWRLPQAFRPSFPKFEAGQIVDRLHYQLAGVLIVPEEDALRHASDYTEAPLGYRWSPKGESWSCNAGDVFIVSSPQHVPPQAFALCSFSSEKVIFQ